MAITAMERPRLIVAGAVVRSTPRYGYDNEARRRTTEVVGHAAIIAPNEGAPIEVRYSLEDGPVRAGDMVAVVVSVQESREFGTFLNFERHLTAEDLDTIARDALATTKAA